MASLTIRKLDDAIKSYLRLRSAKNGRSVEEEVRVILREYCEGSQVPAATASSWRRLTGLLRSPWPWVARQALP